MAVLKHNPVAVAHALIDESVGSPFLALTQTHGLQLLVAVTVLLRKVDELESRVDSLAQHKDDWSSRVRSLEEVFYRRDRIRCKLSSDFLLEISRN